MQVQEQSGECVCKLVYTGACIYIHILHVNTEVQWHALGTYSKKNIFNMLYKI